MKYFVIIEIEDGFTVVELQPGETAEAAAVRQGGVVVDPGPYSSFEDATDAMTVLQTVADEQEERV